MTDPAAIKATFSDFQLVKTRKLAKLIFEVPIEEADKALTVLGGLPRSDRERWVGIALLNTKAMEIVETPNVTPTRRAFCDLPFPQQAALKSNDATFQLWMSVHHKLANDCAGAIRAYCGVNSRADILPGTPAGDRWIALLREFENYR